MEEALHYLRQLSTSNEITQYITSRFSLNSEKGLIAELYFCELLRKAGWPIVKHTGGSGDGGVDIEVYSNLGAPDFFIQIKNTSKPIGLDDIYSEFNKSKRRKKYEAGKYLIVSMSGFTKEALSAQLGSIIQLIDGREYIQELLNTSDMSFNTTSGVKLFGHNQNAYNLVKMAWADGNRAAVVHATATGKMYILAKLAYDAILAKEQSLIVAPTYIILQKIKNEFPFLTHSTITFSTYSGLNNIIGLKDQFKNIFLDEFHHIGAEVWGGNVEELLDSSHNVVGFSATPQRKDGKDVFDILDNNIVSEIDLFEAIASGILTAPQYITALYSIDDEISNSLGSIESRKNIEPDTKKELSDKLNHFASNWKLANGIPTIFKKHLNSNQKKFIVFYDSKEHLESMQRTVEDWFRESGRKSNRIKSFVILSHSDYHPFNDGNLEFFEKNNSDTCLLHCVNMMNEGYHLPGLDGAIFLRKTNSYAIFMQQLGRPMQSMSLKQPIIFDFVNNSNNSFSINFSDRVQQSQDLFDAKLSSLNFLPSDKNSTRFDIFDYISDFQNELKHNVTWSGASGFVDKINIHLESRVHKLYAYLLSGGQFKTSGTSIEARLYITFLVVKKYIRDGLVTKNDIDLLKAFRPDILSYSKNKTIDELCNYVDAGGKISYSGTDIERSWFDFLTKLRRKEKNGNLSKKDSLILNSKFQRKRNSSFGSTGTMSLESRISGLCQYVNNGGKTWDEKDPESVFWERKYRNFRALAIAGKVEQIYIEQLLSVFPLMLTSAIKYTANGLLKHLQCNIVLNPIDLPRDFYNVYIKLKRFKAKLSESDLNTFQEIEKLLKIYKNQAREGYSDPDTEKINKVYRYVSAGGVLGIGGDKEASRLYYLYFNIRKKALSGKMNNENFLKLKTLLPETLMSPLRYNAHGFKAYIKEHKIAFYSDLPTTLKSFYFNTKKKLDSLSAMEQKSFNSAVKLVIKNRSIIEKKTLENDCDSLCQYIANGGLLGKNNKTNCSMTHKYKKLKDKIRKKELPQALVTKLTIALPRLTNKTNDDIAA